MTSNLWSLVVLAIPLYLIYKIARFIRQIRKNQTSEFIDQPAITSAPCYKDPALIEKANNLPVASIYMREGNKHFVYQPREGYCGHGSVNSVLRSLTEHEKQTNTVVPIIPFPAVIRPFGVNPLCRFMQTEFRARDIPFQAIEVMPNGTIKEFRDLLRQANNPRYRFVANFLRSPMFYCDKGRMFQIRKLFGGHFSPIGGYLEDEDLVYVLDVNAKFGFWLVSAERMYQACATKDFVSGAERGLIRVTLY